MRFASFGGIFPLSALTGNATSWLVLVIFMCATSQRKQPQEIFALYYDFRSNYHTKTNEARNYMTVSEHGFGYVILWHLPKIVLMDKAF